MVGKSSYIAFNLIASVLLISSTVSTTVNAVKNSSSEWSFKSWLGWKSIKVLNERFR